MSFMLIVITQMLRSCVDDEANVTEVEIPTLLLHCGRNIALYSYKEVKRNMP
jgi:hypothetical protein